MSWFWCWLLGSALGVGACLALGYRPWFPS